jgi:hypothetical protein
VRTHWEPEKNEKNKFFSIVGENINFKIFFLSLRRKIKKGKKKLIFFLLPMKLFCAPYNSFPSI